MSGAIAGATQLERETLVVSAVDASPGVAFCTAMGFTRVHERVERPRDERPVFRTPVTNLAVGFSRRR